MLGDAIVSVYKSYFSPFTKSGGYVRHVSFVKQGSSRN